jgi:hypothetical protein
MAFVSIDELNKQPQKPTEELPGNIFTDIPKAAAYGLETQIVSPLLTESSNIAALFGKPKLAEFFKGMAGKVRQAGETGWESPAENPVALAQFGQHPIRKSFWNAAASAPLAGAAAVGTILSKNPAVGSAIFAAPIHGQFLEKGLEKGMTLGEVNKYAAFQAVPQIALESLPLPGLLKGGALWKRIARQSAQESIEEGVQQPVQNWMDKYLFKVDPTTGSMFYDIMDGTLESMAAGYLSGGFMGAIAPATIEDRKADISIGREKLVKKGATPDELKKYDEDADFANKVLFPEISTRKEVETTLKKTFTPDDTQIISYMDHLSKESETPITDKILMVPFNDRPKTQTYLTNLINNMGLEDAKKKKIQFQTLPASIKQSLEYITWVENKTNKTPQQIETDLRNLITEKLLGDKAIVTTGASKAGFDFKSMVYSGALKAYDTIDHVATYLKSKGILPNELNYSFVRTADQEPGDMVTRLRQAITTAYNNAVLPGLEEKVEKPQVISKSYPGGAMTLAEYFQPYKEPIVPQIVPTRTPEGLPIPIPQIPKIVEPRPIQTQKKPIVTSPAKKSRLSKKKEVLKIIDLPDTEAIHRETTQAEQVILMDLLALKQEEQSYYKNRETIEKEFEQKEKEIFKKKQEPYIEKQRWVRKSTAVSGTGPTGNLVYLPLDLNRPEVFKYEPGVLVKLQKALNADKERTCYLYFTEVPSVEDLKKLSDWNRIKFKSHGEWKPGVWIKNQNLEFVFPDAITEAEIKRIDKALSKQITPRFEKQLKILGREKTTAIKEAWKIKEKGQLVKEYYINEKNKLLNKLSALLKSEVENLSAEQLSEFISTIDTGIVHKEIEDYESEEDSGDIIEHLISETPKEDIGLKSGEMGLKFKEDVTIVDIYGNAHSVKGPFRLVVISNENLSDKEREVLGSKPGVQFIDGDDFIVSVNDFIELQKKIASGDIQAKSGMNEAFGGLTPEARQRYKDLKADDKPVDVVEVQDVMPNKIAELNEYINKGANLRRIYPMKLLLKAVDFLPFGKAINTHLDHFFGKEMMDKARKPLEFSSLADEIITNIFADKTFRRHAKNIALDQMRPFFEIVIAQSRKDFKKNNPNLKGADLKREQIEYAKSILGAMAFAAPEVFCNGSDATKYQFTDAALPGAHLPSNVGLPEDEAKAYVKSVLKIINTFKIPILDVKRTMTANQQAIFNTVTANGGSLEAALSDALFSERMEKTFWNLIVHPRVCSDDTYQKLLVIIKGEVETPLLDTMVEAGVFNNADMFNNIMRGYSRRLWLKKEQQARDANINPSSLSSTDQPGAKYRTYYEFAYQSELEGLEPVLDYVRSMHDYIMDSLITIQQTKTLKVLKAFNANVLPDKFLASISLNESDTNSVKKILNNLKLVEYESSDNIKALEKLTGKRPNDILEILGYIQEKKAPGLVEWNRGAFIDPYVYDSLARLIDVMFAKKDYNDNLSKVIMATNIAKRWLTVNPWDSTFLWMSGVLMNTNPLEITTRILPSYIRTIATELPFVGKTGQAISRGEHWHTTDIATFPLLPKFTRWGFPGTNIANLAAATWDDYELGKYPYPELNSPFENIMENISSVGGTNAAIFQQFIFREVYHVLEKRYNQLLKEGFSDDDASRMATKFVSETSFMLSPDIFGKDGKILSLALFTRQLTVGFIRQLTGAMYPVLKGTGLYKYHTGSASSLLNSWFHGETKQSDMDYLAKYYAMHIGKMLTVKILAMSLIQYMLSFGDDDKEDEHGEIAKGKLDAKKRYMSMNEPGKRWVVRTPWKDINQRRIYLDFQVLREANQLTDMLGWFVDKSWGQGPGKWFMNRINTFPRWVFEVMTNSDFQGQPITNYQANNPEEFFKYQMPEIKEFFKKEMMPFGFKKEPAAEEPGVDSILRGINFFGGTSRRGMPLEEGYTAEEFEKMKRLVAFFNYKQKMETKDMELLTPDQLADLPASTYLSPQMIRNMMMKKTSPVYKFWRANRGRITREESEE